MTTQADINYFLDRLCSIFFTNDDIERGAQYLRKLTLPNAEILRISKLHKVQTIFEGNLNKIYGEYPRLRDVELIQLMTQESDRLRKHLSLLQGMFLKLTSDVQLMSQLHNQLVFLKGTSVARFYPVDNPRWMRDIDLFVRSLDQAFLLWNWFHNNAFQVDYEELPWIKVDSNGSDARGDYYGQFVVRRTEGDEYIRADIHYNRYSVGYSGFLRFDLLSSLFEGKNGGSTYPTLSAEGCLILLFAHMPSMGYVAIKDLNDFAAIVFNSPSINWDLVAENINMSSLSPQAACLAKHITTVYQHPRIDAASKELLSRVIAVSGHTKWVPHDRSWRLRAKVNADYTFSFERVQGENAVRSLVTAAQCYIYYLPRLELKNKRRSLGELLFLKSQPQLNVITLRPDRRVCIRLQPIQTVKATDSETIHHLVKKLTNRFSKLRVNSIIPELIFLDLEGAQFALTPRYLFACSLDYIIGREHNTFARTVTDLDDYDAAQSVTPNAQ